MNRLDEFIAGIGGLDQPPWFVAATDQSATQLRELFASDGVDLADAAQARAAVAAVLWAQGLVTQPGADLKGVMCGLAVTLAQMAAEAGR